MDESQLEDFGDQRPDDLYWVGDHTQEVYSARFYIFNGKLDMDHDGSPVDRRPSTAEAPPTGDIHPVSKMAVTFEPLIGF